MSVKFRSLTVTPDHPVAEWGVEGIVAAIDRGGVEDWSKVIGAIRLARSPGLVRRRRSAR